MFLDQFHSDHDGKVRITPQQASRFAKEVANDFNPIHDPDAKRFCVPGDLLFSLVLAKYGVSESMSFSFKGMVGEGITLVFPRTDASTLEIADESGKVYLQVERDGPISRSEALIEGLARNYVAFSGQNFPHILVPLMAEHRVMINPERPLVIYESMAFKLDRLDVTDPALELANSSLEVEGKRGDATLAYELRSGGETIGSGSKKLVLSGLRGYEEDVVQGLIHRYDDRRATFRKTA